MATSFDVVNDLFFKRVINDPDFFEYYGVPDAEVEELMNTNAFDYMIDSIGTIKLNTNPEVDFDDYDENTRFFGFDFTKTELQIFADLMFEKFLYRDVAKLKIYNKHFTSQEIKLFSPAEDRRTFMAMYDKVERKNIRRMRSYNSRDRLTGELKSYSTAVV